MHCIRKFVLIYGIPSSIPLFYSALIQSRTSINGTSTLPPIYLFLEIPICLQFIHLLYPSTINAFCVFLLHDLHVIEKSFFLPLFDVQIFRTYISEGGLKHHLLDLQNVTNVTLKYMSDLQSIFEKVTTRSLILQSIQYMR